MPHYREMAHHRGLPLKKRKEPLKSNAKLYVAAGVFVVVALAGAVFIPGRGSRMPDRYELNPTEAYGKEHRALEKALEENVASAKARGASREVVPPRRHPVRK